MDTPPNLEGGGGWAGVEVAGEDDGDGVVAEEFVDFRGLDGALVGGGDGEVGAGEAEGAFVGEAEAGDEEAALFLLDGRGRSVISWRSMGNLERMRMPYSPPR